MIRRTVLEWQKINYGSDPDDVRTIPHEAADNIAAVAAASPLPVLEHGRKALRARGAVGIIAAEGCSLEILPKIDVGPSRPEIEESEIRKRLVNMLAVAYDMHIDVGMITELQWQSETLLEILIRVFADKLTDAVRKGMPRRYIEQEDDLPVMRGSLDVVRQFTVFAANPSRLACRFDDLSEDMEINRIMKAAVTVLRNTAQSRDNQRRLRELSFIYADISDVPVSTLRWDKATIDRSNERWRDLLELARLLLENRFQTTTGGSSRGFSLLFEMNVLFEEYIGRLMAKALSRSGMRVVLQGGRRYCLENKETNKGSFQTKPDILIKRGGKVVQIIDTKWKRISPHADDQKGGMSQSDVYQMMAYSQIYGCPRLMLLYPHHANIQAIEGIHASYRIADGDATLHSATFDVGKSHKITEQTARILNLVRTD